MLLYKCLDIQSKSKYKGKTQLIKSIKKCLFDLAGKFGTNCLNFNCSANSWLKILKLSEFIVQSNTQTLLLIHFTLKWSITPQVTTLQRPLDKTSKDKNSHFSYLKKSLQSTNVIFYLFVSLNENVWQSKKTNI